jgi:5-methylcytosine-specific restriction protein A
MKRARSSAPELQPLSFRDAGFACELCERRVRGVSRHHLIPKSEGGEVTVDLCATCHKTLHKFFTNRTLARELNSIAALRRDPEVQRYLKWVRRQSDAPIRVRTSRRKR